MKVSFLRCAVIITIILVWSLPSLAQWIQTNGPYGGGNAISFAVSGTNIFAGIYDGGIFFSTNNGASWTAVNTGLTNKSVHALAVSGTNLFAGTDGGGVFLSTNNGTSWTPVNTGLTYKLYEEVKDDTLSGNAADVWNDDCLELKINPQPTDSVTNSIWGTRLTALGMGSAGVVAADSLNNVSDSQKQWSRRTIPGGYALELAVKWSTIQNGSETITPAVDNIFGMAINQADNDSHGRQATIQWAVVLLNEAWETPKYLGTVKFLADNKLQFIPTNNMTGATNPIPYDGSNYDPTGIENASTMIPEKFDLSQNYPNPFNPQTTIEFAIPERVFVTLKIYNVLGQEIATLVNEELSAGYYKTTWNAGSAPSGVYFYRLHGGSFTDTRRLVLLK